MIGYCPLIVSKGYDCFEFGVVFGLFGIGGACLILFLLYKYLTNKK